MKNFTKIFISIFFIGFINFAPGTLGSLISIFILFILFKFLTISILFLIIIFIFLFFISNILINKYSLSTNSYDSKNIIIDEFLGIFFIFFFYDLIFIYNDIITLTLIFFSFRFFDIFKIFPANYIDKNIKNGYGVILDDIVAAIYTILILGILNAFI